jgi:hypothetical protein
MYCALEAFVTNNGTTIPSPVDIEQWKSNPPYQLNGCVRVSRVYTDSNVGQRMSKVYSEQMSDSMCASRIPPDGQESAALLRHAELNGNGSIMDTLDSRKSNGDHASVMGTLMRNKEFGTLNRDCGTLNRDCGTLNRECGTLSRECGTLQRGSNNSTLQRNNDHGTLTRMRIQGELSTFQSTLIRNNLKQNGGVGSIEPNITANLIPDVQTYPTQQASDYTTLLQPVKADGSTSGCSSS